MESRATIFDSTIGPADDSVWLDRKVLRRELTADLSKKGLEGKSIGAIAAAEGFLDDMTRRAQARAGIEKKSEEIRRQHEQMMREKASAYRERLRGYLRPELRD